MDQFTLIDGLNVLFKDYNTGISSLGQTYWGIHIDANRTTAAFQVSTPTCGFVSWDEAAQAYMRVEET